MSFWGHQSGSLATEGIAVKHTNRVWVRLIASNADKAAAVVVQRQQHTLRDVATCFFSPQNIYCPLILLKYFFTLFFDALLLQKYQDTL